MPMTHVLLMASCALLPLSAWSQRTPPGGCRAVPATCSVSLPVFDFGRAQMNSESPAVYGTNSIAVTCVRSVGQDKVKVDVDYVLSAVPAEPARSMRNNDGGSLRYFLFLDSGRTRHWGDGVQFGTFTIQDRIKLDDRNMTVSNTHVLYGSVDGYQVVQPGIQLGLVGARLEYQLSCK
jgi:spore coat protein U-like protein